MLQTAFRQFLIMTSLLFATSAFAQFDPSSALLFNGSRGARENSFDSGRYTVRPKEATRREDPRAAAGKRNSTKDSEEEGDTTPVTVTVPPDASEGPQQAPKTAQPDPQPAPIKAEAAKQLPPRDVSRRLNLVEVSFAPGYLYSNSDSNSYYRRYTMAVPVLSVDANVWLSPYFGLNGSYAATLSGHVGDSLTGNKNVPATHEWFTAGFRSRRFFGSDVLANTVALGLDYYDYHFRVPSDASYREKLSSVGVRISLEAEMPMTIYRSWVVGIFFAPKLAHREEATGTSVQSGGNVDANMVGISVGGRMQFERKDAIFWKITHQVEKDMYSGEASAADPAAGQVLTGVSVTNSISIFTFGYTWGD